MTLAFGAKISAAARALVIALCARIGIDPSWLMAIMWFESRLNPAARNAASGATGLIQFMPNGSIRELGTTPEALAAMPFEQQLVYVERYFVERGYAGRMKTLADAYMAVFWPAAIGRPDSTPLIVDATSKAYVQNKGLDVDKDGQITKAEAAGYVVRALAEGLLAGNATVEGTTRPPAATQSTPNQREGRMSTIDNVAGIASIFNPLAGGVIGLAGNLFKAMQPTIQSNIAKAINQHTDDPSVGIQVASDLANFAITQAKALTGKNDDFQAVAAITTDPAHAADLAKLEGNIDAQVDRLMKAGDKASTWDQIMWKAGNEGKQTVSSIAIAEKQAGLWDMTRTLVLSGEAQVWALILGSFLAMCVCLWKGKVETALAIFTFIGTLGGWVMKRTSQPVDYRFDGTKESTAQSQALVAAATKGNS